MYRASLIRSTPFRLALTFAFLFVLAFIMSGVIVYRLTSGDLADRLDRSIKETYAVVAATYTESDVEDLVSAVDSYAQLGANGEQLYSLSDRQGRHLAGNFAAKELPLGFSTIREGTPGIPPDTTYRAFSGEVGGNRLTVAVSFSQTEALETTVLMGFGWATLLVTGLAIVGGALLASRVQRRLDGIAATMVDVSHGRLDARIPLIGNGDDIDVVSGQVNAALDRLSALVEGMKQVSTDIAHDLKTPLNRLQMILESAAEKTALGEDMSDDLAEARAEGYQINETFEALLRIAQVEAGARKARFTDLELDKVIGTIAEIYGDVAEEDGKSLVAKIDGTLCTIHGDRELLMQMFANLVENSLRHCPVGTAVALSVVAQADRVVAAVRDSGPGIPTDEREKVFRRLYRLDKSRSTPGSGLGLSLVRAIADLHGASIALEDCGPGLAVVISFPLVRPATA